MRKIYSILLFLSLSTSFLTQSPGGVAGPNTWLKGDAGTGAIGTSWQDQSGNTNDYTTVIGPSVVSNAFNYNPGVEILNGGFNAPAGSSLGTSWSVFFVAKKLASDNNGRLFEGNSSNYLWGYHDTHEQSIYLNANPNNYNSGIAINNGALNLLMQSYVRDNGTGGLEARANGNTLNNFAGTNSASGIGIDINQGAFGGSQGSDSRIGEFIIYNSALSGLQVEQVESYLGIKYGFTLGHDYWASNGTTKIWDATADAAYHNNVTGIGLDNNSALDQRKSINISGAAKMTMEKVGGFGVDQSYVVWGSNNLAMNTTIAQAHPAYTYRLNRIWKANVKGTPGAVSVRIIIPNSGNPADYALLADNTDIDFSSGASAYAGGVSISGDTITFAGVTLVDGDFFTLGSDLAITIPGPGGVVSNISTWLRPDIGSGSIGTAWEDQTSNNNNYTTVPGPSVVNGALNYNSGIEILSGGFTGPGGSALGTDWSIFFVSQKLASDNNGRLFQGQSGNVLFGFHDIHEQSIYVDGNPNNYNSGIATPNGGLNLRSQSYIRDAVAATIEARADGAVLNTFNGTNSASGVTIGINQGAVGGQESDSRIGDFILFNDALSSAEVQRVESYLGIKYGLTLSQSYLASDGIKTIWDVSTNVSYNNDIIGIGQDNLSVLTQKQSHTLDDVTRVYLSTLAAQNSLNIGSFSSDLQFLMVGHNTDLMCATVASNTEKPASITSRIAREWKVTNTNFNGSYSVDLQLSACADLANIDVSDLRLLVDTDDGNFVNSNIYSSADGLTFTNNAGTITIAGITTTQTPFNNTSFITLGSNSNLTPLPIELISFEALKNEELVDLIWSTASEINNELFTIERSIDGAAWYAINSIEGAGNSSQLITYKQTDNQPLMGNSYYRLKQIDFDGQYSYSAVKMVKFETDLNSSLSVYPNPTSGHITIVCNDNEMKNIKIIDLLGKDVTNWTSVVNSSNGSIILDLTSLESGVYLVNSHSNSLKIYKD